MCHVFDSAVNSCYNQLPQYIFLAHFKIHHPFLGRKYDQEIEILENGNGCCMMIKY
jgi:hypothetical protein